MEKESNICIPIKKVSWQLTIDNESKLLPCFSSNEKEELQVKFLPSQGAQNIICYFECNCQNFATKISWSKIF